MSQNPDHPTPPLWRGDPHETPDGPPDIGCAIVVGLMPNNATLTGILKQLDARLHEDAAHMQPGRELADPLLHRFPQVGQIWPREARAGLRRDLRRNPGLVLVQVWRHWAEAKVAADA